MHWIDRGPEPDGVAEYDRRFTPGWLAYHRDGVGAVPEDHWWGEFRPILSSLSNNECWYCGRQCDTVVAKPGEEKPRSPTVDHFRPRNKFPDLTYQWSNWVFSCHWCNHDRKKGCWPAGYGYVDPAAADPAERPEQYFDYDELTGMIIKRENLSETDKRKAKHTIRKLRLNDQDLTVGRWQVAREFEAALLAGLAEHPVSEHEAALAEFLARPVSEQRAFIARFVEKEPRNEFTWVTRIIAERMRQAGRIPAE